MCIVRKLDVVHILRFRDWLRLQEFITVIVHQFLGLLDTCVLSILVDM